MSFFSIWDTDSSPGTTCWNTGCAILPLGYLLLLVDSYFDFAWVLFPSPQTKQALVNYYTTILTPSLYSPGYYFPVYVIYKLCLQCPTIYHYGLLLFFAPVARRYVGILKGTDTCLNHWWTIVVCRIGLFIVNTLALRHLSCRSSLEDYHWHFREAFLTWNTSNME